MNSRFKSYPYGTLHTIIAMISTSLLAIKDYTAIMRVRRLTNRIKVFPRFHCEPGRRLPFPRKHWPDRRTQTSSAWPFNRLLDRETLSRRFVPREILRLRVLRSSMKRHVKRRGWESGSDRPAMETRLNEEYA